MSRIRCSIRYFCLSTLLIFVGTVLLCALGITVVLPYRETRHWLPVACRVTSQSGFNRKRCSCSSSSAMTSQTVDDDVIVAAAAASTANSNFCALRFPCLQVYVVISDVTAAKDDDVTEEEEEEEGLWNSTLFLLYRSWTDSFYAQCTLHECSDEDWSIKESKRFQGQWGEVGKTYQCYVDPTAATTTTAADDGNGTRTVILERTTGVQAMHAVLWPSLCLAVGLVMWLGLFLDCCIIELIQLPELPSVDRTSV